MNFADFASALEQISADKEAKEEDPNEIVPIKSGEKISLNPDDYIPEINRLKKQAELSHKQRQKKNKKIERSMGYYDRIQAKDKQESAKIKKDTKVKKVDKKDNKNKHK